MDWPRELERMIRHVCGPEDEFDPQVNGDPDSTVGEEDETGFDEMADWPEPDFEPEDDGDEDEDDE